MKSTPRSLRIVTVLGLVAVSALVALAAPASADSEQVPTAVNVSCADQFRSDTGYFAGVFVTQIIQDQPTDPSSYVSDTGYFAGQELQVIGRFVDCVTN